MTTTIVPSPIFRAEMEIVVNAQRLIEMIHADGNHLVAIDFAVGRGLAIIVRDKDGQLVKAILDLDAFQWQGLTEDELEALQPQSVPPKLPWTPETSPDCGYVWVAHA